MQGGWGALTHRTEGSKRLSLHKKHKIERKLREHGRKIRKEGQQKKGTKKDPGIPNLWPFKEELLQQMERAQAKKGEEADELRRQKDRMRELKRQKSIEDAVRARREAEADEAGGGDEFGVAGERADGSRRAFLGELRKVVEASDVLLEVLDARDPVGSRCVGVERFVTGKYPTKRIILVLNKIDLVPREAVEQWLRHLRNELPTVAFKCSTQQQRSHLAQGGKGAAQEAADHLMASADCLGSDTLLQLLKNYARSADMKTSVTVGVVGLPNVGKSSLINSLKRSRVVQVGATPGVTRAMQEVHLDKNVKLLDCPGVVLGGAGADPLRNSVKVEQIADPVAPVEALLKRCRAEQLMVLYHIPAYASTQEFLFHVAKAKGKLRKGGVPDAEAAARIVLQDWNTGRISYYTMPPAPAAGVHVSAAVLPAFSDDAPLLARLSAAAPAGALLVTSAPHADTDLAEALAAEHDEEVEADEDEEGEAEGDAEMGEAEEGDEDDEDEEGEADFAAPPPPRLEARPKRADPRVEKLLRAEQTANPQTNKKRRAEAKAAKKKGRKAPQKEADDEDSVSDVSDSDQSSE